MTELRALKEMPISFPGLFGDWSWNPDPVAIHIGHGVYWYGIILACAMLCGAYLSMKLAKRVGLTEDHILDLVLRAVPCCILGSRTYYVVFNQSLYRRADGSLDWGRVMGVWDGGIAIYGTVIAGFLVAFLFARRRKIPFGALADAAVPGLLLGQAIGRWANLINREAFGSVTDLPWRMRLWVSATESVEVHPTFLYESLWNFLGLALMLLVVMHHRRFDGENAWFYFLWYGLGRVWIEGLRTDSLYLFGWTIGGQPVRVSQFLSAVLAIVAAAALFYELRVRKRTADSLYVNRESAQSGTLAVPTSDLAVQSASPAAEADTPAVQRDTPSARTDAEVTGTADSEKEIPHGTPNEGTEVSGARAGEAEPNATAGEGRESYGGSD